MFPSQRPYEKLEFILRRHWLILAKEFVIFGVLLLIGIGVYYMAGEYFGDVSEVANFIFTVYVLIVWQFFFVSIVDYYLDTWIVSDHRIIDIHQTGFFKRDVSELRYSKIQDVSVKVNGFIPTIFNYGDLVIQTAGAMQEFHFQQIPKPNLVRDRILHLHDKHMRDHVGDVEIHDTLGEGTVG